jgi:thiamine pyrophosphate-dependent acetolactate synthase large subunit-like protein
VTDLRGGAAVVRALEREGVRAVFGIPGTHNLEIYRALAGSEIAHVTPRHEQGAGYAADASARLTGVPGVCVTTGGPGVTNIATAVATAYADSVPMLVVAPGPPRGLERRDIGLLHEMRDQRATMAGVVEHATRVDSPSDAAAAVAAAFARARVGRPRPEYIEVPLDVLEQPWDGVLPELGEDGLLPHPPGGLLENATTLLMSAERPVVVVGGGSRSAAAAVLELVELLGCPVITTVNAKGIVDERHPLALGASLRLRAGSGLVDAADVALLVATEYADSDLWEAAPSPTGQVIRVDVDQHQLDKNLRPTIALHGRAEQVIADLVARLRQRGDAHRDHSEWIAKARSDLDAELARDDPIWGRVQDAVRAGVEGDVIVAGDSAMVSYFGTVHHWPMAPADRFVYPTGYATLGYAVPAAVGAKVARPDAQTVALLGDGGFMFTAQEVATAAELRLNLPIVVVNNGGYAAIRDQMEDRGFKPLGVDLAPPDLRLLGVAFGGRGKRVDDLDLLTTAVAEALAQPVPTVIELDVR